MTASVFLKASEVRITHLHYAPLNTSRFQLARIYEKTGVTRHAELVKMMMRLSSGPGES